MSSKQQLIISKLWDGSSSSQIHRYVIEISFAVATSELIIEIDAPYHNQDPAPPSGPGPASTSSGSKSERFVGLWEYEVVELFIAPGVICDPGMTSAEIRDSPYLEINVGPHGHYYLCSFPSEANFGQKYDEYELEHPLMTTIDTAKMRWRGRIAIPSFIIPEPLCSADLSTVWAMNAYAIFGSQTQGNRTFMAHSPVPGEKPNFHQLQSFVSVKLSEDMMVHGSPAEQRRFQAQAQSRSGLRGILFSQSTVLADNSNRLIEDMKRLGISAADDGTSETKVATARTKPKTMLEVARTLKEELALPDMEPHFMKHIHPDEFVVLYAKIWKRKGWSHKKRMLILTSKPRLFYVDLRPSPRYKGSIMWTLTNPIECEPQNSKRFDIKLNDGSRTFHINDKHGGSARWVKAITAMNDTWAAYFRTSVGSGSER